MLYATWSNGHSSLNPSVSEIGGGTQQRQQQPLNPLLEPNSKLQTPNSSRSPIPNSWSCCAKSLPEKNTSLTCDTFHHPAHHQPTSFFFTLSLCSVLCAVLDCIAVRSGWGCSSTPVLSASPPSTNRVQEVSEYCCTEQGTADRSQPTCPRDVSKPHRPTGLQSSSPRRSISEYFRSIAEVHLLRKGHQLGLYLWPVVIYSIRFDQHLLPAAGGAVCARKQHRLFWFKYAGAHHYSAGA